ncbi:hypothetical protein PEC18_06940 [Paucibacter sp. O1-1]|nr:hypothetical protein [Paucibacter sp. O1-1]MDA3825607.1 hypothetical protein [Paucibacter sp. O1-1]
MRTGSWRPQGFTYLGMLFFVAITAAAMAALGQSWTTAAQRERERELEFRGQEIARAIASYLKAGVPTAPGQDAAAGAAAGAVGSHPRSFEDLLVDRRGIKPRHHLRRAYVDPMTGKPDWVLVPAPTDPQGFHAVHSRAEQTLLRRISPDGEQASRASDWLFSAAAAEGAAKPDPAASAASAPL